MYPKELSFLLKTAIQNRKNVLISGAPGIGKTDIVKQVCEELRTIPGFEKLELIISHPVVSDPTDYKGLPFEVNGEARFLPFNDLKQIIDAEVPTVFFIDDFGQAEYSVQKATMQLLWGGKLNGHKISPYVTFIGATNRKQDKAGVTGMLECVKSRFHTIIELTPSVEDWIDWAKEHEMPMELIAFVRFRERESMSIFKFEPSMDVEKNSPCPRTIANVGQWMNLGINPINNTHFEVIKGAIGEGLALELKGFLTNITELPDIDELIKNADKFMTPRGYKLPANRPDLAITICGALVHRINKKNCDAIMTIASKLEEEYAFMLCKDAIEKFDDLKEEKSFMDWAINHKEFLDS